MVIPLCRDDSVPPAPVADPASLCAALQKEQRGAAIGYVTDVGWTPDNARKLERFFPGLTLLCAECTFLAADVAKARASCHLCSDDLNRLVRTLSPAYLAPLHLSKSYLRRTVDLYQELVPPSGTTILRPPRHIVPPPLGEADVREWLRP